MYLDKGLARDYNALRNLTDKKFLSACYAPFVNLMLSTNGDVSVCGRNHSYIYGNISEMSLARIWESAKIRIIRDILRSYNFPSSCGLCRVEIESRSFQASGPLAYDLFPVEGIAPQWPQQMEFFLTNLCNFQCIMCKGSLSSTIREKRDQLPPLPRVYGDRFFDELQGFLPHLKNVLFLGGEPFMMPEVFRILKMMMDLGLNQTPIRMTTNGSILTKKVQEALENLKIFPVISFDAVKKNTFESIRLNSKFEAIVANIHRFKEIVERNGADVTFSVCLMRQNWREFIDVLLFAENLGCRSQLSFVVWPDFCSLATLPRSELAEIIKQMEKRGEELLPKLHLNRVTFIHALELLRGTLDNQRSKEMKQLCKALGGADLTSEESRSIDKAWLYIHAGEYGKAIAEVKKIPATHGDYYFALNVKGHAKKLLKEYDAAQAALDEAIGLASTRSEAYHEKAFLFYDQGNAMEALRVAEQYLAIDPNSYHTWVMKGTFLRSMKNHSDAMLTLAKAIDLDKNQPEAFIERAWLNLDLGHWEDGLDDVSRAQALFPPPHLQAPLSNVTGFLWLEAVQPDQAAVCFKRFCEIQPENPKAWVYLARAQQAIGDWIGAMETLSEALRLDPHDPEALAAMERVKPLFQS